MQSEHTQYNNNIRNQKYASPVGGRLLLQPNRIDTAQSHMRDVPKPMIRPWIPSGVIHRNDGVFVKY